MLFFFFGNYKRNKAYGNISLKAKKQSQSDDIHTQVLSFSIRITR